MDFLFAINIFLIFFSLAECYKENVNKYKEARSCKSVRIEAIASMTATSCRPRPELIELTPELGFEYQPRVVSVNRCTGVCMNKACIVEKSKTVERVVRRMKKGRPSTAVCAIVEVEEDTECGCQCKIQARDCEPAKQEYDRGNCSCRCKNREKEKMNCEKDMGMKWIDEICACKCMMKNMTCSSGENWDSDKCKCVPMLNNNID